MLCAFQLKQEIQMHSLAMLVLFQVRHIHEYNTTGVQDTTTRKLPIATITRVNQEYALSAVRPGRPPTSEREPLPNQQEKNKDKEGPRKEGQRRPRPGRKGKNL
jgi:hypothetical protein